MPRLTEIFGASHRVLEQRFAAVLQDEQQGHWESDAFVVFRTLIEQHMTLEETVLFPRYEQGANKGSELPDILRKGHRDMSVFFDEIADAWQLRDHSETGNLLEVLGQILEHHDTKEEAELYPVAESLFSTDECAQLAQALHVVSNAR